MRPWVLNGVAYNAGDEVPSLPRYRWRRMIRRRHIGIQGTDWAERRIQRYRTETPEQKEEAPQDSGATETTTDSPNSKQGGDADKAPEATGDSPPVTDKPVTQEGKDGS